MIKQEEIGNIYTKIYNGMPFTVTISEDPKQYKFYRTLSLDVFEEDEKTILEKLLKEKGIRFRKNSSIKTLKQKLNDSIAESDDE